MSRILQRKKIDREQAYKRYTTRYFFTLYKTIAQIHQATHVLVGGAADVGV